MNVIKLNDTKTSFDFSKISIARHKIDGAHGLSVDGTGKDVSVSTNVAQAMAKYIVEKFETNEKMRVLDVGTGRGHMVKALLDRNVEAFGIEGSSNVAPDSSVPKDRIACIDLSKPIGDRIPHKSFNLTTSFEVMEHVHRKQEDIFLANLAHMADFHLCSIHMDGWPGVTPEHCNIKHECCWLELFRKYDIGCQVIGRAPKDKPDGRHAHLPGSAPTTPVGGNEELREHVKFHQWGEWECSMFCILDFTGYKPCE